MQKFKSAKKGAKKRHKKRRKKKNQKTAKKDTKNGEKKDTKKDAKRQKKRHQILLSFKSKTYSLKTKIVFASKNISNQRAPLHYEHFWFKSGPFKEQNESV